jgi:hypothetical protein
MYSPISSMKPKTCGTDLRSSPDLSLHKIINLDLLNLWKHASTIASVFFDSISLNS